MGDNISRLSAVERVMSITPTNGRVPVESVTWELKNMPSSNDWVPCNKRLPQIEQSGQRRGWYLTTNIYGCVNMERYEFYDDPFGFGWDSKIEVVAWMPLPEPYKGGAL